MIFNERELGEKKLLIVSAVNIIQGGTLTILIESLDAAAEYLSDEWNIVAIVHDVQLIKNPRVQLVAFPDSKRSWLRRVIFEWWYVGRWSKNLKVDLWLSLHDITPRVRAKRQAVYCHNPSPFYRLSFREAILDPKFMLFNLFYKYLYRINMHRNFAVVVQQDWLRVAFRNIYNHRNIIVAHPVQPRISLHSEVNRNKTIFLYPTLSRFFKNIEVLCQAAASLPDQIQDQIEIRLTIDGSESWYARNLKHSFGHVKALRFIGRQNRSEMAMQYSQCDVVLFPSKLETWGLPISEAKTLGKALLVADLPYAHETVGTYSLVSFLHPDDVVGWANAIQAITTKKWSYLGNIGIKPSIPYADGWQHFWAILTQDL